MEWENWQIWVTTPAPGGKTGTPDIIFKIEEIDFVLEVTTFRPKSTQFTAEGASVPDHVRLYKEQISNQVVGIFCAPQIHLRNTNIMKSSLLKDSVNLICINDFTAKRSICPIFCAKVGQSCQKLHQIAIQRS